MFSFVVQRYVCTRNSGYVKCNHAPSQSLLSGAPIPVVHVQHTYNGDVFVSSTAGQHPNSRPLHVSNSVKNFALTPPTNLQQYDRYTCIHLLVTSDEFVYALMYVSEYCRVPGTIQRPIFCQEDCTQAKH
jgi:hypothetical protein